MKLSATLVFTVALVTVVTFANEGHDHDTQMPLDYVKFPYQAVYPGDNEGA